MLEKILLRILYKKFQKGKKNIVFTMTPDHLADCIDKGHIRKIEFHSGNVYNAKFVDGGTNTYGDLWWGKYEISKDIQELSFEEFCSIAKGTGFHFKRA